MRNKEALKQLEMEKLMQAQKKEIYRGELDKVLRSKNQMNEIQREIGARIVQDELDNMQTRV